jgi:hypothetical protein
MQEWIVAAIVACAFFAVLKRYAPKAMRRAVGERAAAAARSVGWNGIAAKWEGVDQGASCGDGCGTCGGCGTKAAAPQADRVTVRVDAIKRKVSH